jgi:hypothetical protein
MLHFVTFLIKLKLVLHCECSTFFQTASMSGESLKHIAQEEVYVLVQIHQVVLDNI